MLNLIKNHFQKTKVIIDNEEKEQIRREYNLVCMNLNGQKELRKSATSVKEVKELEEIIRQLTRAKEELRKRYYENGKRN